MLEILKKATLDNVPFWVCTIVSLSLLVISLFIPPVGVIDSSVIAGVGEIIGIMALWTVVMAIRRGIDTTVKHKDTEITLSNPDKTEK